MERELTEEQVEQHNLIYRKGWALIEGELVLDGSGSAPGKPGWFARRRLRQAITCFESALKIDSSNWSALWALGKIYQRLGDAPAALSCFARAHQINPGQPDVAREAGIAATQVGDGSAAVRFSRAAISAAPDDPGLVANLALALLITGETQLAQTAAADACSRAPDDAIARAVRNLVDEVVAGRRPQPKNGRDLGL